MKSGKNTGNSQQRPPTLEDVARAAGLSPMTVSRALNNPQIVRPETIGKVMEAVRATGYIPNMLAGGLASKRSKLIAVVVPQINNNMFVDTVQAISDELAVRGYHMLLCVAGYTHESETDIVATILSRRPDGIVLTGIHHSSELKKIILNASIPVVEIWDLTPTPLDMLVGFSHERIGNSIAQYLLIKGYLRLGLLWTEDRRAGQRKKGIHEIMQAQPGCHISETSVPLPATLALGRRGLSNLLADGGRFDAIICSSDTLAQGAIMEAGVRGLSVPDKLAVIGFGDLDFASHNTPSITTIRIDRWKIGKDAAAMLAEKIEGKNVTEPIVDIGFSLIERESA
ncbi:MULTISPECIES: LacI family DNA-binding transcriptional regulator [unclassified Brenneria]|uniref:LacI family DNA-binding transcriptional regulator n=1 Tax=unclassified Brenneria TaxID=2634434 RepID=UPI0018F102A2|nr:LacI family DNA-binding transcriptional regulator [Brenneria sp. L3-3C-1]MBJ7221928.1 LacI family DNA-binding transcriptional regulator [Brenneria sp. L3-3C-1]MEE3643171.1 LacI family DNA-binding transcriptional regulator [Brenneria sp. L3_3C_1]